MMKQTFRNIWPAVLAIGSVSAYASLNGAMAMAQDAGQPTASTAQRTDGQIETDVVRALDAAPPLKNDWITAGTEQGIVTLTGTSANADNRRVAEMIAGKVPGVTKVVNDLKVGDPQTAQDAQGQSQDQAPQDQGNYADNCHPAGAYDNGAPPPNGAAYPQQPGNQQAYPPNYQPGYPPAQRGGYNQAPVQPQTAQAPEPPHGPVTLPQGTLLKVRTSEPLNSKKAKDGEPVQFTVVRDVYVAGVLAIPRGATIHGQVVDVKHSGALGGSPELALKLASLDLGGNDYALDTDPFSVKGPNKAGRTVGNAFGGAILGAIIGGAVGGGGGAAIGAGAGAVGGTAATAATPGPQVWIPAEALMDFHLNTPLTVAPVSWQEAQRLAANAPPPSQRPTLYRRGYYPYGYPPPPPPGYYYRPY